jgi:hypothetical protein
MPTLWRGGSLDLVGEWRRSTHPTLRVPLRGGDFHAVRIEVDVKNPLQRLLQEV